MKRILIISSIVLVAIVVMAVTYHVLSRVSTGDPNMERYTVPVNNHMETREGQKYRIQTAIGAFTVYMWLRDDFDDTVYDHDIFLPNGQYLGSVSIYNGIGMNEKGEIEFSVLYDAHDLTILTNSSKQILIWKKKNGSIQILECSTTLSDSTLPKELFPFAKEISQKDWYWFTRFSTPLCLAGDRQVMMQLVRYSHAKFTQEDLRANSDNLYPKEVVVEAKMQLDIIKMTNPKIYARMIQAYRAACR